MVIFANILLFIWSSKNCDIIYLKKKLKRIIGPDKLEEEAIRNLIFICMKQQCIHENGKGWEDYCYIV